MNEDMSRETETTQLSEPLPTAQEPHAWQYPLTHPTPFSRALALVLFVVLPVFGFWLGVEYSRSITTLDEIMSDDIPHVQEVPGHDDLVSYTSSKDNSNVLQSSKADIYRVNDAGELIKKLENGSELTLVSVAGDMREDVVVSGDQYDASGTLQPVEYPYMRGKVLQFYVSPDGTHIAYIIQDGLTMCCGGEPSHPDERIMVMTSDGEQKRMVERSPYGGSRIFFRGWMYDNEHFVFQDQHLDGGTQGSPYYIVAVMDLRIKQFDTGNPLADVENIALADLYFSPTEDLVVYRNGGLFGTEMVLSRIDGSNRIVFMEVEEGESDTKVQWRDDGTYVTVYAPGKYERTFSARGIEVSSDVFEPLSF